MAEPTEPSEPSAIDVLLVDDHQLLSESLALALRAEGLSVDIADLSDRQQLIDHVRRAPPRLVLLDLDIGGEVGDGVTLVRLFHEAGSAVMVLTGSTDRFWLGAALEQGAVGVRSKAGPFDEMLADIMRAAEGAQITAPQERARVIDELQRRRAHLAHTREPFDRLTDRERQVLRALGRGHAVAQIAAAWVVSEATVRSQVRGVLTKLGVGSQLEAVALALRAGWLRPLEPGCESHGVGPSADH